MRPLARWGTLPILVMPLGTWALGLGEIELDSALNQPLVAEIELVSATPEELEGLRISLAGVDAFERYGLERPGFLSSLRFDVGTNAAGGNVIHVRSTDTISEPFVTMLIEAEWSSGRILREYTVFLDPPTFLPEPAAPAAVEPAQTRAPQETVAGGAIPRPAAPAPTRTPTVQPTPAQPRPQPQAQPAAVAASADGTSYGPVQNGETLWGIATRYRPQGVTMNQMMLAVYEANPQAFVGNMNHLSRGAILRIPPASALQSTSVANATAEVRRQEIEWAERRAARTEPRLTLLPPTDESVSVIGAGGDSADAAELSALRERVTSLEEQLSENERLLSVRDSELADLQQQLSAANEPGELVEPEQPIAADPGVELESEQLFVDETPVDPVESSLDEAPIDAIDATAEEPVIDEPPTPAPTLPPAVQPTTTQPSLVDRVLEWVLSPMAAIGGGVLAVLIAALLFLRRRRGEVEDVTGQWEALEAELDEEEADHAATTRLRAQVDQEDDFVVVEEGREAPAPMPDASASSTRIEALPEAEAPPGEQTMSSQTVINLDQADPIAEADFHMAYGLYDQAADLVAKALEADPGNRELKLKLLEVFFVWGNRESFLQTATGLRQEMGDSPDGDWDKVVIMGKQICPDEALFAEATAAAGEVDLDLEAGDAPSLDLSFKEGDEDEVDLDFGTLAEDDIELEATGGRQAAFGHDDLEATGKREQALVDDDVDLLDIGERTSAGLEAALFETDGAGEETSPDIDVDSLAVTQESPTVETPRGPVEDEPDWSETTMESPTIEQAGPEISTLESTALEAGEAPTVETPTIEQAGSGGGELTAELDLDALGLAAGDIDGLPSDLGDLPAADGAESDTREQPAIDADDDLLSATGVTHVLHGDESGDTLEDEEEAFHASTTVLGDEEATMMAPGLDDVTGISTEVLDQPVAVPEPTGAGADGLDLELDDLTQALKGSDTVEQPRTSSFDSSLFDEDTETPVDLDVGTDVPGDDEPTGTEEVSPLDPQTMTEVGTKLDLARAYIDMGDPEGAKSILEEVMSEGDTTQRQEAQTLLDALPA